MSSVLLERGREVGYRGLRMTAEEHVDLPPDGFLRELFNGLVWMSSSPAPFHQQVITRISARMDELPERNPMESVMVAVDVRACPAGQTETRKRSIMPGHWTSSTVATPLPAAKTG